MNSELLDKIRRAKEKNPSIGLERENFCVRKNTFEQVNQIDDTTTPLIAVRELLQKILKDDAAPLAKSYVEELVKCVNEVNGEPTHSPRRSRPTLSWCALTVAEESPTLTKRAPRRTETRHYFQLHRWVM